MKHAILVWVYHVSVTEHVCFEDKYDGLLLL